MVMLLVYTACTTGTGADMVGSVVQREEREAPSPAMYRSRFPGVSGGTPGSLRRAATAVELANRVKTPSVVTTVMRAVGTTESTGITGTTNQVADGSPSGVSAGPLVLDDGALTRLPSGAFGVPEADRHRRG
jgi:hypothetical protein